MDVRIVQWIDPVRTPCCNKFVIVTERGETVKRECVACRNPVK